jgi:hypothetical protein
VSGRGDRKVLEELSQGKLFPDPKGPPNLAENQIDRVTLVKLIDRRASSVVVVVTTSFLDMAQVSAALLPGAESRDFQGKLFFTRRGKALALITPNSYVFGPRPAVKDYLRRLGRPAKKGPLSAALRLADKNLDLLAGIAPPPRTLRQWRTFLEQQDTSALDLLELKSVAVTATHEKDLRPTVRMDYGTPARAKRGLKAIQEGQFKQLLGRLSRKAGEKGKARFRADLKVLKDDLAIKSLKRQGEKVIVSLFSLFQVKGGPASPGTMARALNELLR